MTTLWRLPTQMATCGMGLWHWVWFHAQLSLWLQKWNFHGLLDIDLTASIHPGGCQAPLWRCFHMNWNDMNVLQNWRCPKTLFSWHQKPIFRTLPILKHTHATFVLCIPCCFYQQDDFDAAKKLGKWSWEGNTFRKSQYVCLRRPESNGKGKANFTFNYMDFGLVRSLKFHCWWISLKFHCCCQHHLHASKALWRQNVWLRHTCQLHHFLVKHALVGKSILLRIRRKLVRHDGCGKQSDGFEQNITVCQRHAFTEIKAIVAAAWKSFKLQTPVTGPNINHVDINDNQCAWS